MKAGGVVLLIGLAMAACDSTPGVNPFVECLVVFTIEPPQIQLVRGDSVIFSARRYNFCSEQRTAVHWRLEDSVVATFRPVSDSSGVVRAVSAGTTVLIVIDRADTLHRAGVPIIVRP